MTEEQHQILGDIEQALVEIELLLDKADVDEVPLAGADLLDRIRAEAESVLQHIKVELDKARERA